MMRIKQSILNRNILVFFFILILIIFILDTVFLNGLPNILIGRFNVTFLDVVSVLSIFLVFIKLLLKKFKIRRFLVLPLILGVILLISYVRGVNIFGFEKATASFRSWLYFYSTLIFTLVYVESKFIIHRVIAYWTTFGWILFCITILRWVMFAAGLIEAQASWMSAGGLPMRVINAAQTLFLLQVLIFAFILKSGKFHRLVPVLFIPAIILLQHRTVWAIILFLIGIVITQIKQKSTLLVIISVIFLLLSAIFLILVSESSIALSLRGSALNFNTFFWRIEGWRQLLSPNRFNSIVDYFIGQPFGTGFDRFVTSSTSVSYLVEVSPHNFYIFTILTIGGIGLLILLAIYYKAIISLIKHKKNSLAFAFLLILISQLLYSVSNRPSYEQGFLLGAAVLVAKNYSKNKSQKFINR